jgi:hypothetical protein
VSSSRSYWFAAGFLVLAWAALASPWLSGTVTIPYDAKAHFQAQIQFLAHALHSGQSPFWSPNVFAGSPQIADPQSMMFSPALLLAMIDDNPSFRIVDSFMFLYLLVGGLALLMLFRERGWHPVGGVVAALAFAFGASASSRIQHFGQIHSLAFFAISLWLLDRTLRRARLRDGLLCGLAIGLMVVEPDQVGFLALYLLAGMVVYHILTAPARGAALRRLLAPLALTGLLAGVIAGGPVLLTYLFLESSNRPEIAYSEAALGSMHPASLLTTVIADLYGAISAKVDYWGPSSAAWPHPRLFLAQNMGQVYVGALPIVAMLVFGFQKGRLWQREVLFFVIALAFTIMYALGEFTPAFPLFFDTLPGVDLFRRPADATFLIGAMLAIIGGYVVHRIASDGPIRADGRLLAGLMLLAVTVAGAVVVAILHDRLSVAELAIGTSLAWSIAAAFVLILLSQPRIAKATIAVTATAAMLMVADLASNQGPNESTALSPKIYDVLRPGTPNPTIKLIKARLRAGATPDRRDRVELVGLGFQWPNAGMVHGFDHTLGYNPLRIAEFTEATGAGDQIANPEDRKFTPLFPSYHSLLANMLGLRLIISPIPIERVDKKLKPGDLFLVGRTADGYAYENPNALPRVLFASDWQSVDFEALIKTGHWPDFDPRRTVLLESEPGEFPHGATGPAHATVGIESYRNGRVDLVSDSDQPGFVVLNDSWHPWWYAEVDGVETPVLKANVLFRAVRVPAGHHKVHFEFRPFRGAAAQLEEKFLEQDEEEPSHEPVGPAYVAAHSHAE